MPGEFRIDVERVERGEAGAGRVDLRIQVPEGLGAGSLDKSLAALYAKELGLRVGLRVRRLPWGDGIRVRGGGSVVLSGLDAAGQVQLETHAIDAADECNRDLRPEGKMGAGLHQIVRRLGPRS